MENGIFNQLLKALMEYKGVGFISLQYRNKEGELSKRLMNIGAKLENAKKSDIDTLNEGVAYISSDKYTKADWDMAMAELKTSLVTPDKVRSDAQKNAYTVINENNGSVKINHNQLEFYLWAKSESKVVLEQGVYKVVKSSAKTIAKKSIQKAYMKSAKFRTMIIKNAEGTVKVNKQVINVDGEDRNEDVIEVVIAE
jgi:hypothetical protein